MTSTGLIQTPNIDLGKMGDSPSNPMTVANNPTGGMSGVQSTTGPSSYGPTQAERDQMAEAAKKAQEAQANATEQARLSAEEEAKRKAAEEAAKKKAAEDLETAESKAADEQNMINAVSDAQQQSNEDTLTNLANGVNASMAAEMGNSILAGNAENNITSETDTNESNYYSSLLRRLTATLKGEEASDQAAYLAEAANQSNEASGWATAGDYISLITGLLDGIGNIGSAISNS